MTDSDQSPSAASEAVQWQARYQKLRREFERLEAESRQRYGQYADIIGALQSSQSFDDGSANATLDNLLAAAAAEKPIEQLGVQVEAFGNKLQQLATLRGEKNQRAATQLLELLERLHLQLQNSSQQAGDASRIKKLKRELEKLKRRGIDHRNFDMQQWFEKFAAAQPPASAEIVQGKRSWFDRFRRVQVDVERLPDEIAGEPLSADTKASEAAGADEKVSTLSADQDSDVTGEASPEASRHLSAVELDAVVTDDPLATGEIAAILLGLLADIEVPVDARDLAQTLYSRLEQGLGAADVVPALDDSVRVVGLALRRDQVDFQGFLQGLDDRLVFLNDFLNELTRHLSAAGEDSAQLEQDVRNDLQAMRSSVAESTSIEQLKERVSSSVEHASGLLEQFAATQRQRQAVVESRAQDLQQQIAELEQEAEQSRQSLERQREKLLRDRLTGLPNREAYENRLDDEYARWRRYQRPLAFVIADIDHFKQINDQFGHAAGDKVLALVAKLMREKLRDSDFIARYGGEEFAIVLPETTVDAAGIAIEKLRAAIAQSPFNFRQTPVSVTCSFGITGFQGEDTLETVFERADQALYRAKQQGRNQYQSG